MTTKIRPNNYTDSASTPAEKAGAGETNVFDILEHLFPGDPYILGPQVWAPEEEVLMTPGVQEGLAEALRELDDLKGK